VGDFINSFASTVTGDKSARRYENILCAGLKSARNILTKLSPTYISDARTRSGFPGPRLFCRSLFLWIPYFAIFDTSSNFTSLQCDRQLHISTSN